MRSNTARYRKVRVDDTGLDEVAIRQKRCGNGSEKSQNVVAYVEYATITAKQTVVEHINTAASSCMTHIQGQQ
jgi:hypothetical protein